MPTAVCPNCGRIAPAPADAPCGCGAAAPTSVPELTLDSAPPPAPAPADVGTIDHDPPAVTATLDRPPPSVTRTLDAPPRPFSTSPGGSANGRSARPGGMPGELGRFEVLEKLGEGAFGEVFRARDPRLARDVALKVAKAGALASPAQVARFLREARAAANLRHPHIVPLYETGEAAGRHFIAAAYVRGRTLAGEFKDASGPINPARVASVIRKLADALGYAHRLGVVHRDVKPANVLVDEAGDPHLADFGLAVILDEAGDDRMTRDGEVMGTPAYMSPEQAAGHLADVGPATDQYALGVMLYELLVGRRPFIGDIVSVLRQQVEALPPRPRSIVRSIPLDLETICLKCLEKDPRRRYPSCEALAEDLRLWSIGEPVTVRRPGAPERLARWARRSPFQAATAAALLLLVVVGGYAQRVRVRAAEAALQFELADNIREQKERDERRRNEEFIRQGTVLYQRADAESWKEAPDWAAVERDATAAAQQFAADVGPVPFPLLAPARLLADRARGELAGSQERLAARAKLGRLGDAHAAASVFGSDYSGLDPAENAARTRAAVAEGLALFGVAPDGSGPPAVDPRFFSPAEVALIADRCYELLLLDAQSLARASAGGPAKPAEALARLDRADRLLGKAGPAKSGLVRRAALFAAAGNAAGAVAARKLADETPPRLAADQFAAGLELYRRDEFEKAVDPLSQALRLSPDHYGAEYLLAVCRLRDEQYPEAREGLTRCLERQPKFPWPRLLRGYAAMKLERWPDAEADFDAVLKNPPDAAAAYVARVNRGVLELSRRDWDKAEDDFRRAIAARPGGSAAHLNLALAVRQRAEPAGWLQELLLLGPGGPLAAAALEAVAQAGRRRSAELLGQAVRDCPGEPGLFHERGRLRLQLGDFAGAKVDFRRAVELAANRGAGGTLADDLIEWGRLLQRDGDPAAAAKAYRSALDLRPDKSAAWRLLGQSLLAQKRYAEAGDALDRYLAVAAAQPGRLPTAAQAQTLAEGLRARGQLLDEEAAAYRARGLLHTRDQNLRAALEAYTRGLALVRDPESLTLRGWTYLTLEAPTLAAADFDEAVRRRPADADARIGRANARVLLGRVPEALADADVGSAGGAKSARGLYNAARVYAQAAPWAMKARGDLAAFRAAAGRAVELLRDAEARTPEPEREAFWRDYVRADRAFDAIRSFPAMVELMSGIDAGPR